MELCYVLFTDPPCSHNHTTRFAALLCTPCSACLLTQPEWFKCLSTRTIVLLSGVTKRHSVVVSNANHSCFIKSIMLSSQCLPVPLRPKLVTFMLFSVSRKDHLGHLSTTLLSFLNAHRQSSNLPMTISNCLWQRSTISKVGRTSLTCPPILKKRTAMSTKTNSPSLLNQSQSSLGVMYTKRLLTRSHQAILPWRRECVLDKWLFSAEILLFIFQRPTSQESMFSFDWSMWKTICGN